MTDLSGVIDDFRRLALHGRELCLQERFLFEKVIRGSPYGYATPIQLLIEMPYDLRSANVGDALAHRSIYNQDYREDCRSRRRIVTAFLGA